MVEGVGGLLRAAEPLVRGVRPARWRSACPWCSSPRPGLGTINHTLLTLKAARGAGLEVAAVLLSGWPEEPSVVERSNRETIAALGAVEVLTLPLLEGPDPALLESAGEPLPWRRWL